MKRIVCFHLFNDYSGSPKVLRLVLEGLLAKGYRVDLVSSLGGVLDTLDGAACGADKADDADRANNADKTETDAACAGSLHWHTYSYKFSERAAVTMLRYAAVQLYTFFLSWRWLFARHTVFYINTLLPVGPALAGRLMGKRVVYHYHENAFVKGRFYRALAWAMQRLASEIVCVSAYQASFLRRKRGVRVVPNALPPDFVARLHPDADAAFRRQTVLMLSSLKAYKGTAEFTRLAQMLPQYKFVLVINDTQDNIDKYLADNNLTNVKGGVI